MEKSARKINENSLPGEPTPTQVKPKTSSPTKTNAAPLISNTLRYSMIVVLVLAVTGISVFAFVRQNSIKAPAPVNQQNCKDPVQENRLRQTLRQNPNDFVAQMDWGAYNLRCTEDFAAAISAFELAQNIAKSSPDTIVRDDRFEASISLGQALLRTQRTTQAERVFRDVLAEDAKYLPGLLWLGISLYQTNPNEALTYLQQVTQLSPNTDISKLAQELIDDIKSGKTKPQPTTR